MAAPTSFGADMVPPADSRISPKSYGVAVALSGIFGIIGIHHFYLGNWLHGLIDLGLSVAGITCIFSDDPMTVLVGAFLLFVDVLHTIIVIYRLFVGKCRDGQGLLVAYPGQFNSGGDGP